MPLSPGIRLGPYEVLSPIGAGGMGEVYKATDTRLNRTVAIKVLPPHWVRDPEMKQRFDREAQTIASLTHPHICTLHDIGSEHREGQQPIDYLVMEHLEGQTLAKRLERGALPLDEALKVGIAIADALDCAHRAGIVHRDLKPANVMLTPTGPKLLDFGLAKTADTGRPPSSPSGLSPAPPPPTTPARPSVTAQGMIVGTLQYMAPEQIEGAQADARSDIFAFGAIFHEMVTGARAFEGKNRALLIAAIATLELDPISKTQRAAPPALDHVAQRCLAKDPEDRWQTAHDLAVQLKWIASGGVASTQPATDVKSNKKMSLFIAAALVLLAVTAGPAIMYLRGSQDAEAFQFRIPVAGLSEADIALSPDGQMIALVARPNAQEASSLFVRLVGATTFRKLAGTDDATLPFWSPDSRTIAFAAGGRLKRVDATGGAPKDLGEAVGFAGGAWSPDNVILFGSAKGLFRVSEGGATEQITSVEKPEAGHLWPSFLPDGRRFVYFVSSDDAANRAVFVGSLASKDKIKLMSADSNAVSVPGYLVFHREATLFAYPFDGQRLTGDPIYIADRLAVSSANGRGHFAVSQNGVLLYAQNAGAGGGPTGRAQVVINAVIGWSDKTGKQLGLAAEQGTYGDFDLSPDGKFVAVTRQESGPTSDIWVIDWERALVPTRLTRDPADDLNPVWSPTGDRIAFTTFRKGNGDVYVKNANGVGDETPLLSSAVDEQVEDWSKDGKFLAYKLGQGAYDDLYVLPLTGEDKKPIAVVTGPYKKDEAQFSYDGKWLAYTSNESGTFEVYVDSFPNKGEHLRVSALGGGGQPRWTRDGKTLYYRGPDGAAMAVDLKVGTRLEAAAARRIFPSFTTAPSSRDPARHQWNVTPDGLRFLVRYANNSAAGFLDGRSGATPIPFNAPGALAATQAGAQAFISSGLTVIRNWPAVAGKAGK
jgi:serine/threonine protein kinase/Tol biopolymer transport system component